MVNNMETYMILYRESGEHLIDPWGYKVLAEDLDHAEEQFENANPDCEILWVEVTDDYDTALENYYTGGM